MDDKKIRAQSEAAYKQWAPQWREQAKAHAHFPMKRLQDFENVGIGKAVLCIANGFSFEENIETIKKLQGHVDILVCDKTLGHCLDNGITPTYVLVCDANVNYEKYMEPWKDRLRDTILFSNVCANPKWAHNGNWKDKYFFINKDILGSEREFAQLSGCKNFIPAGTNVSNAMVVFLTQSDNNGRRNFFGYDKILLIGYDYSWRVDGKYYSFNETGDGKANYMRHSYLINLAGSPAYTSGNLAFSADWLQTYVKTFALPVIQCSKETILSMPHVADLESQMQYKFRLKDQEVVRKSVKELREVVRRKSELQKQIESIGKAHHFAHLAAL